MNSNTKDNNVIDNANDDITPLQLAADINAEESPSSSWSKEGSQVQIDLIEWWCHELLQSIEPLDVQARGIELQRAVQTLGVVHSYGRLFNRIQMAGLTHLVCGRPSSTNDKYTRDGDDSTAKNNKADDDAADSISVQPLSAWSEHQWRDLREQIILAKSYFLRCDANLLVLPFLGNELPPHDDNLDSNHISSLPSFHEEYKSFLSLVSLHAVVARFRSQLTKLRQDSHRRQNEQSSKSRNVLLKKLEKIVDDYKIDLGEACVSSLLPSSFGEQQDNNSIYKSLTSFLLPDLYGSIHDSIHSLPQKLSSDLNKVMMKAEEDGLPHSYASLQGKWRWLAFQWCDKILDTPRLVQLGYSTISGDGQQLLQKGQEAEIEKCSVSSWGNMGEERKEREETMKEVDDAIAVAEQQQNKRIMEEGMEIEQETRGKEKAATTEMKDAHAANAEQNKEVESSQSMKGTAVEQPDDEVGGENDNLEEEEDTLRTQGAATPVPLTTPQQATQQHEIESTGSTLIPNEEFATQPIQEPPISPKSASEMLQIEEKITAHESADPQTQEDILMDTVVDKSEVDQTRVGSLAVQEEPESLTISESEGSSKDQTSTSTPLNSTTSKDITFSVRRSGSTPKDTTSRIIQIASERKRKKFTESIVEWSCSSDDDSSLMVQRKQERRRKSAKSPLSLLVRKKKNASRKPVVEWPSSSDDEDDGKMHIARRKASFRPPVGRTRSDRGSNEVQTAT